MRGLSDMTLKSPGFWQKLHTVYQQLVCIVQGNVSPAFSLNENPAFDREGNHGSLAGENAHEGDTTSTPPGQMQGVGAGKLHQLGPLVM